MSSAEDTSQPEHASGAAPSPRIVAIDFLRGAAILWVVLFHLWEDVKVTPGVPADYFSNITDALRAGDIASLPTALLDAVLRVGYQGVPVFMMLSGLSLYLSSARSGGTRRWAPYLLARFRRIMLPYWFGFGVMLASVVVLAALQAAWFGTSFREEYWHGITITQIIPVRLDFEASIASLLLVPRMLRDEWLFVPNSSLWFVVLIAQYYLMFPLLRWCLDRFGPWPLLAAALAITIGGKLLLIAYAGDISASPAFRLNLTFAPFRMFEFALGMALGYWLVHRPAFLREYLTAPADIAGIVAFGLVLQVLGSALDSRTHYLAALSMPLVILGLTLICAPLIAKPAGRLERAAVVGIVCWIGVMSYAALITNEPLRLVSSTLQLHDAGRAWWWLFLAAYVPLTLATARPVAALLGLLPEAGRASQEPAAASTAASPVP